MCVVQVEFLSTATHMYEKLHLKRLAVSRKIIHRKWHDSIGHNHFLLEVCISVLHPVRNFSTRHLKLQAT